MTKVVQSSSEPMLVIVIEDETSTPKVKYNGEEVTLAKAIDLIGIHEMDRLEYAVQHMDGMEHRTTEQR